MKLEQDSEFNTIANDVIPNTMWYCTLKYVIENDITDHILLDFVLDYLRKT